MAILWGTFHPQSQKLEPYFIDKGYVVGMQELIPLLKEQITKFSGTFHNQV